MTTRQKKSWAAMIVAATSVVIAVGGFAALGGDAAATPDRPRQRLARTFPPAGTPAPACPEASPDARPIQVQLACSDCDPASAGVEILFDRVVDAEAWTRRVRVTPAVALTHRSSACTRRLVVGGAFDVQSDYTLVVPLGDGTEETVRLATGGGHPVVQMPSPDAVVGVSEGLPILLQQVRTARLRAVALRPNEIPVVARAAGWHEPDSDPVDLIPASLRRRVREQAIDPSGTDANGIMRVDPFTLARATGPVFVVLDAPGSSRVAAIVQRATHALVLKVGDDGGLVWLADARTGAPAANAQVTLYEGTRSRFRGRTDADGLVRLPNEERLRGTDGEPWERPPLVAVARTARDTVYATERFDTGMESWALGLPWSYGDDGGGVRGMITPERGIYRPGESVHLLGIVRELGRDGRLRAPRGSVTVEVLDPDGTALTNAELRLNAFGTFRQEVEIPDGSRLGRYQVIVRRDGDGARARRGGGASGSLTTRFEVGEYRANTFEVELPPAGDAERSGDRIVVPVRARYLYGAPVRNATVAWNAMWRPRPVRGEGLDGFTFGEDRLGESLRWIGGDSLTLDANGEGRIEVPASSIPIDEGAQAIDLVVEATVTDAADDAVTARTAQSVSARSVWLGLANERWVVPSNRGWDVRAIAVAPDGRRVAGERMSLRLVRKEWVSYAQQGQGGYRYGGEWQDVVVATREVRSGARPVDVHFDLPGGGTYRAELVSTEGTVLAHSEVWAWGAGGTVPVENHPRMNIVADRASYSPGDRAKLFAQVPWPESVALVTVERAGVIDARVVRLEGTERPIDVAIEDRFAPNVYVGVAAVPVADGASPVSGIPFRIGYRELEVSPEERRLSVEVTPVEREHRPGTRATVDVRVRDHEGRPVRGEVTLWAADEGVLQLTGYRTPDPFEPAYARHLVRVSTAASVARWAHPEPDTWYEGGGDGGGEAQASALRSRFLSTAFFSRGVVTDREGRARVRFDLPDNLTRWRVMAAVADRGERFGKGESSVITSKPLSAMPSLPRFLTQGDLADLGVVVHNHTGAEGVAEVRIEVEGKAQVQGESVRRIRVGAGEQVPVRFAAIARAPGEASVRARVRLGTEEDGFRIDLPVHPATSWSSQHVGEGFAQDRQRVAVRMPRGVEPGQAELVITLSQSVYASMERGLESLIDYPHGCVEQTTSRLIPMVLLEEIVGDMADPRFGAQHRQKMKDAIAHVLRHQNPDGGFGLWPDSSSEGFLTAYALWGLLTARDHGYTVNAAAIERGASYLERHAQHGDDMHGQFSNEEIAPFSAYVLAYARRDDRGLGRDLARQQQQLSRFSVGLLANALTRRQGAEPAPLFGAIEAARRTENGRTLVRDPSAQSSFMHYGGDLRATASAVSAYVAAGRHAEAGDLVAGILAERDPRGDWGTTYNNMWALHALAAYAESDTTSAATIPVEVSLGGRRVASASLTRSSRVQRIVIPASALPNEGTAADLVLSTPSDARVRYSARLRYVLRRDAQRAESQGYRVHRELLDAETGRRVETPRVGQLLRVRLRIHADRDQSQVALVDRLPAGLEPVDTSLETSQRSANVGDGSWAWVWREIHDERVSFFADRLSSGTHTAEYLARATRSGEYVRPAATAEAMYDPRVWGRGEVERVVVARAD